MPWVLTSCEARGQSKEAFMVSAQAKSKNAWVASQQAAFLAFKSALLADQSLCEAQRIRSGCWIKPTNLKQTALPASMLEASHRKTDWASSLLEANGRQQKDCASSLLEASGRQKPTVLPACWKPVAGKNQLCFQLAGSQWQAKNQLCFQLAGSQWQASNDWVCGLLKASAGPQRSKLWSAGRFLPNWRTCD